MGGRGLPQLASIAQAVLRSTNGQTIEAASLWTAQPQVVIILRRPGCVLCRDEAQKLWACKPELDKLGVGLVCVVHEWIQREVDAFVAGFWPGPLYHDVDKAFYKALNGGTVLRGSLWGLTCPWSPEWKRIHAASKNVKEHNVVGDGLTMGGAMVVGSGSQGVVWMHVEESIGLVPGPEEVLEAARKAAAAAR